MDSDFLLLLKVVNSLREKNYVWKKVLNCKNRELVNLQKKLSSHPFCKEIVRQCKLGKLTHREKDFCKRLKQKSVHSISLMLRNPEELDNVVSEITSDSETEFALVEQVNGRIMLFCYSSKSFLGHKHWIIGSTWSKEKSKAIVITVFPVFDVLSKTPLLNFFSSIGNKNNQVRKLLVYPCSLIG